MDGYTFTVEMTKAGIELIKAFLWPFAVCLAAWWLKDPLADLIPLIKKLKVWELEVEIREGVAKLSAESKELEVPAAPKAITDSRPVRLLSDLRRYPPVNRIIFAWESAEAAARAFVRKVNLDGRSLDSHAALVASLRHVGAPQVPLTSETFLGLKRTYEISRNLTVLPSEDTANAYVESAERLIDYLDSVTPKA